jgi:hypothetical protein
VEANTKRKELENKLGERRIGQNTNMHEGRKGSSVCNEVGAGAWRVKGGGRGGMVIGI